MQARYMYSSLNWSRISGSWMLFGFRYLWPEQKKEKGREKRVRFLESMKEGRKS